MRRGDRKHLAALVFTTQMVGGHQTRQQQDGGQLHCQHIGAEQGYAHLFRTDVTQTKLTTGHAQDAVGQKAEQDERAGRGRPRSWG